jgi:hypothetical protein
MPTNDDATLYILMIKRFKRSYIVLTNYYALLIRTNESNFLLAIKYVINEGSLQ